MRKTLLTDEQKDFILANAHKKFIVQMARELDTSPHAVSKFIEANRLQFKRAPGAKFYDRYFAPGCFNPHERENWLV